ncbi:MAG: ABC transporter substrate-binding protein [Dehalococcoidia bacterium]
MSESYWERWRRVHPSRRSLLGAAGTSALALALAGCGGGRRASESGGSGPAAGAAGSSAAPQAVAPARDPDKPQAGGTLRSISSGIDPNLDPHRSIASARIWHWSHNFLVRFSAYPPNVGLPEPDLAAAMPEIVGDGTTVTFKLRPDAKWQQRAPVNGRALHAEDVKATFDRIIALGAKSPRSGNYTNVDSITVIDPTTVQFKLKQPQADLLSAMADQYDVIIPRELAAKGEDAIKTKEDNIGTGPYELVTFEPGQRFTMKKRADGYWKKDTAWMDGWDFVNQPDAQQQANALRANQTDSAPTLTFDLTKAFESDKAFSVTRALALTRHVLFLNQNKEPFKDPRVRQAVSRAIDRRQMFETVYGGAGKQGGPLSAALDAWALPDAELAKLPGFGAKRDEELTEAKRLLTAAGFPNGFETSTMQINTSNLVNEVWVSNLAKVGIKLNIESLGLDWAVWLARASKREFEMATNAVFGGPYPDIQLNIFHHTKKGTRNYNDFGSADLDAKLDKQSTIYDYKQRLALVHDIQREILSNPGPVWIGSTITFGVYRANIRNVVATSFFNDYTPAEDTWIKKG